LANSAAAPLTTVGVLTIEEVSSGERLSSPSGVLTANSPGASLETEELVNPLADDSSSPPSLIAGYSD
jgi:hypothetical protein